MLEQEGPRDREIWAEENEKKDWKPGAPDRSQQKGNSPLGRNHKQPARHPGNRHKGAQTTDRNLDRESGPQTSQPEVATGAGEPKNNPS